MKENERALGRGEYSFAGENCELSAAQKLFVQAIARRVPAFLEDLRKLYPAYAALVGGPSRQETLNDAKLIDDKIDFAELKLLLDQDRENGPSTDWQSGWTFEEWRRLRDPADRLSPLLRTWSRRFHLEHTDWVLEFGVRTLQIWHISPLQRDRKDLNSVFNWTAQAIAIDGEHPLHFTACWDPQFETWSSFLCRTRDQFERELDDYRRKVIKIAEQSGATRSRRRVSLEHFEWLALFHCEEQSLDEILASVPTVADKT